MNQHFDKNFFRENRRRLREKFGGNALIVIAGNSFIQRSADSAYPFRQDSNFWYLTGLDKPGLILVLEKSREYLILPQQSFYSKTFDGVIEAPELRDRCGVEKIYEFKGGWSQLSKKLRTSKHIAGLEPSPGFIEELDMYTNPARARLQLMVKEQNPSIKFIDLKDKFAELRAIKNKEEITAIKKATEITMEAFISASRKIKKSTAEYELLASASRKIISKGMQHAYEPIVASASNAVTLHYIKNDQKFKKNELVLLDIGAEYSGYASDISRTIGVNPTKRQIDIHQAVLEVQEYALSLIKPGEKLVDIELKTRKLIGRKLLDLKLIKSASKQSIRRYYPHATSHFVGLDAHDPGPTDGVLQPGMVLTVEPGIYVREESIGVRIEDIVIVTKDGHENLSARLSRGIRSLTMSKKL